MFVFKIRPSFALQIIFLLLLNAAFAQPIFILGAKALTMDFKGYSGFLAEMGFGTDIFLNPQDKVMLGFNSGFGYAGGKIKEDDLDITVNASSLLLPLKAFVSYGALGANMGVLISFNEAKSKNSKNPKLNMTEKGTDGAFNFGVMVFPTEKMSIGLDVIINSGVGFALGASVYVGRRSTEAYNNSYDSDDADYDVGLLCGDTIYETFIKKDDGEISICLELNSGYIKCVSLNNRPEFTTNSPHEIEIQDFQLERSYVIIYIADAMYKYSVDISYSEFFKDGCED
jgi:hypothetical protein